MKNFLFLTITTVFFAINGCSAAIMSDGFVFNFDNDLYSGNNNNSRTKAISNNSQAVNIYNKISSIYTSYAAGEDAYCSTPFISEADIAIPEGMELQQIMLVRHGKPELEKNRLYSRKEAQAYIKAYDTVGVEAFMNSPICVPDNIEYLFCSQLERSKNTAEKISNGRFAVVENSMFRKFEREIPNIPFIRMPLSFWLAAARVPWFFGTSNVENYKEAKERSKGVAAVLAEEAEKKQNAILVAHGFLNRFVATELKKEGWHQAKDGGHDFLSVSVFVRLVEKQNRPDAVFTSH